MNDTASTPGAFDYVNPLYGPGSIIGWYLTIIGTMMTWMFHSVRAQSDSIDPDFIICLLWPCFGVGDLVKLARMVNTNYSAHNFSTNRVDEDVPAFKGPLSIIMAGIVFTAAMSFSAAMNGGFKRSILNSIAGVICDTAVFVWTGFFEEMRTHGALLYIAYSIARGWHIVGTGTFCVLPRNPDTSSGGIEPSQRSNKDCLRAAAMAGRHPPENLVVSVRAQWWTCGTGLSMCVLSALTLPYFFSDSKELFQYTHSTIKDPDQMIAVIAGAIVLSFNLKLVVRFWYGRSKKTRETASDEVGDMVAFSSIMIQYSVDPDPERGLRMDAVPEIEVATDSDLPPLG